MIAWCSMAGASCHIPWLTTTPMAKQHYTKHCADISGVPNSWGNTFSIVVVPGTWDTFMLSDKNIMQYVHFGDYTGHNDIHKGWLVNVPKLLILLLTPCTDSCPWRKFCICQSWKVRNWWYSLTLGHWIKQNGCIADYGPLHHYRMT